MVILIVYVFLQDIRSTIIPLVGIIVSLIGTFAFMSIAGFSINLITLFALVLVIGTVVDDAIVDVENVWKHLRENRLLPEGERKSVIEVVFNASKEVRMPILNSTLIIVVSFVPLFFPDRNGRAYAGSVGHCLYCGVVCFYGSGFDTDSGTVQLSVR
mgnify:CR=1 FL=1